MQEVNSDTTIVTISFFFSHLVAEIAVRLPIGHLMIGATVAGVSARHHVLGDPTRLSQALVATARNRAPHVVVLQ